MTLTDRFFAALTYATRLHSGQLRKGSGIPYIAHLLSVTGIVLQHGGTEDEAIAALLHDAVEDQGGYPTLEEIRKRFGADVAATVEGCTDAYTDPKPEWRERKEKYIAHLQTASPAVRLICAADKLDNIRAILTDYRVVGEKVWSRFKGGKEGTLWYYRAVLQALNINRTPLIEALEREISETEKIAGVS
jgi:(p)ppGpp synthase/HD superfamily hydrolase